MSYIIKNTSGLITTRITDVGRRKISEGNFNVSYFQIGDSEVNYKLIDASQIVNNNILSPAFNSQNDTGSPRSNKQNVKYPYYVNGNGGNTYGIPYMDSNIDSVFNSAGSKGFFSANTTSQNGWSVQISSAYTITSNYRVNMSNLTGQNTVTLLLNPTTCAVSQNLPRVGHYLTLYLDGMNNCTGITSSPILTYKIQSATTVGSSYNLTLDRKVPDYSNLNLSNKFAIAQVYPSGMTEIYDTITPQSYWQIDTINFESPCDVINRENTLIWNMNIPWSENPAGIFSSSKESYENFGSVSYLGTKELLGYNNSSGQTDTSQVFYYNSFDEKIVLSPSDQKTIAIIHYTNQDIDFVYGEKFATQPYDPTDPLNVIGLAKNLKLSLPTVMWHKTTGSTIGLELFIDPPNHSNLFSNGPYYIKSKLNSDMNDPGIRYYHLWDNNPDEKNQLNRVGKVFPDQQIIIIDDEELVAALSYKSNRNWTLPSPKLSLISPNTCFTNNQTSEGIMSSNTETMWVTYRFDSNYFTESLHCNYYSSINGPSEDCSTTTQNVAIRFGSEFPFLKTGGLEGFSANSLKLICQKTKKGERPNPVNWKMIDVTSQLQSTMNNGYITLKGMTGTTFEISLSGYNNAASYNLSNYIDLPDSNGQSDFLNFGDEYFFYGNFQTDITATVYQMRYLVTLNRNQFTNTSNPSWTSGTTSFINEIGLYNQDKELMIISKLQSPQLRQGIQQFVVKLDF